MEEVGEVEQEEEAVDELEEWDDEFLEADHGAMYSLPEAELVTMCQSMQLDESGSQHAMASRIIDALEEALDIRVAADPREIGAGSGQAAPSAPDPRRLLGSMRNERFRGSLDWESRVNESERLKEVANDKFKVGDDGMALAAYLAAIWLLKPDNPLSPDALESAIWKVRGDHPLCPSALPEVQSPPRGFEGVRLLGEGLPLTADMVRAIGDNDESAGPTSDALDDGLHEWARWCSKRRRLESLEEEAAVALGARTVELRLSLHLNVAATALRVEDWELAERACAFVLVRRASHPKALLRQAAALKGSGDLKRAARRLETLLGLQGQAANREARQLHSEICRALKERTAHKAAWDEGQARNVREQYERVEADLARKVAEEEARKRAEEERKEERAKEIAALTQLRAGPEIGSQIEVWWEGDNAWSKGEVVARVGTAALPKFKVKYEDDFEMEHDLTSSDKFAFPFRLVSPAPSAPVRLGRSLIGRARADQLESLVRAIGRRRVAISWVMLLLGGAAVMVAILAAVVRDSS